MDNFLQRMKRAMQRGRSASLPPDNEDAVYVLLPYVMQNQVKPVSELLSPNSTFDVNYVFGRAKRTLVHSAANTGAADCLGVLLKKGAHVNVQDKIGSTPLHLAARNGHKKCVQKLVEAGADIRVHDNEGLTALHWMACNGRTELLVSVLESGEYVDVEDIHGHTALLVACQNGHYKCVVQLLEFKADVNRCSKNGGNALYFACRHGQVKCVQLLLDRGALVATDNDGLSVLEICAQGNYYGCVELILSKYPEQVDKLLALVFSQHIEESKMQGLLEYLSNSSVHLLAAVLNKLASDTATAGMELLSISSSYQDLMPQFLRAIRMLCTLHKHFVAAYKTMPSDSIITGSMPNSPGIHGDGPTAATVRRAGSFGSLLDNPPLRPSDRPKIGRKSSHKRSHSGGGNSNSNTPREARSNTIATSSASPDTRSITGSYLYLMDPFEQLEMVWSSLQSWFDLLRVELDRVVQRESTTEVLTQVGSPVIEKKTVLESVDFGTDSADVIETDEIDLSTISEGTSSPDSTSVVSKDRPSTPSKLPLISQTSSVLAAAIVNSAPSHRRTAFLQASSSIDQTTSSSLTDRDKNLKRRSWHVDRVTARLLSSMSPSSSLSQLPIFNRSASTNSNHLLSPVEPPVGPLGSELPEEEVRSKHEAGEQNLVEVYADRLCAVTHAFALTCKTLQRSTKSDGLLPRFLEFINKYENVLKVLLARNPQLIFAHFHFLLEEMELMQRFVHIIHAQPFDDRKNWFYENLHKEKPPSTEINMNPENNLIEVERDNIFNTSCQRISDAPIHSLKKELYIQFVGEAGMGSGVMREWFDNLSQEVLNPDYALFTQSADGATFQPNSLSDVNPDHLSYFRFAGRLMGLALYHKQLLNVYFTRSFYKHILDVPVSYRDVESIDPEYANNLQWILDHEIDSLGLELTFSVETDVFGATEQIELKPGGSGITVTDENKRDYVQLVTEMRMTQAIGRQIQSFLDGFYEVIPLELISLFDEYELELLISGLPDIDVTDWEKNTEYSSGYEADSPVIQWFWEIVKGYDKKELAILLQFATGSSRVPLGGFASLVGATGLTKFTITRLDYTPSRLPMASTCFNLLKLPEYPSKQLLKDRLNIALTCGSGIIDIT
ncbi:E3 ubiquitin-protein ligase HACE1-like [Halichondria panicea]|uniref:E3 ubiquitin-protein ligase HACE1-like n=1 Tax=Halichondria panicea TaxID=6063 RepID=UPI00312B381E